MQFLTQWSRIKCIFSIFNLRFNWGRWVLKLGILARILEDPFIFKVLTLDIVIKARKRARLSRDMGHLRPNPNSSKTWKQSQSWGNLAKAWQILLQYLGRKPAKPRPHLNISSLACFCCDSCNPLSINHCFEENGLREFSPPRPVTFLHVENS